MARLEALAPDPLGSSGIQVFGERLRRGEISAEAATAAYLARIEALEPALGAFEHVAVDLALASARAIDKMLAAGTDLGPLMGVPVAVKDLLAVDGMPTTAGSNVDVQDLIGPEGSFIKALKRAGVVILGKTKTVEFAIGGAGTNRARGTPRNPWDMAVHRVPGGSSSGSAVAMAAGMCALAIGSDTGGSVRGPAAYCGVFGLKTTRGLWPTDGVYALSPSLDSLGIMTASAADAALTTGVVGGRTPPRPGTLRGLRFGKPTHHFFENMDGEVAARIEAALAALQAAGASLVPIEVPEVEITGDILSDLITAEFLAGLGRERFIKNRHLIDRDIGNRGATGLDLTAQRYIHCLWSHQELCRRAPDRFRDIDAWVMPTRPTVAPPVSALEDDEAYRRISRIMSQNTRHANAAGLCATSTPLPGGVDGLPVGMQIVCAPFAEERLLSIAQAVEAVIGMPVRPRLVADESKGSPHSQDG